MMKHVILIAVLFLLSVSTIADTFGTGTNQFMIDFVTIENADNPADNTGFGRIAYNYKIAKYEITNTQWNTFVNAVGAPSGSNGGYESSSYWTADLHPANCVSWYEALQFCNYLTTGDKSKGAYLFTGNNSDPGYFYGIDRSSAISTYGTIYVLPTEDEWYKAAYYKPDGSGYSLYTNGQNAMPGINDGWNYYGGNYNSPWNVGSGAQEQNGTYDMMGNVFEWNETLIGDVFCGIRGGAYSSYFGHEEDFLISTTRIFSCYPYYDYAYMGFRVVAIPEPATLLLLGLGGVMIRRR